MATQEELKVVISTAADLSGARQAQQALQQVAVGAEGANRALQQAMRAAPQTMAGFRAQVAAVEAQLGRRPTLGPEAFGISAPDGATRAAAAPQTASVVRQVGESAHFTGQEFVRMGAAFIGAGIGLSGFTAIGNIAHSTLQNIISSTIALGDAQRANTITLGQSAAGFQQWAATASQQTGFTQRALLEAGTAAQQFARTAGLGPDQVLGLTQAATVLARIHGLDVDQTMKLLTAAMQGSDQAANQLNLQLDDSYVAFTQLGQSTTEVFSQLDPGTLAWLRYQAALGQVGNQATVASPKIDALREAQGKLNVEWERLVNDIGPPLLDTLAKIATGIDDIYKAHGPPAGPAADPVRNALVGVKDALSGLDPNDPKVIAAQTLLNGLFRSIPGVAVIEDTAGSLNKLNTQIADTTGFDAKKQAVDAVSNAIADQTQAVQRLTEVSDESDRRSAAQSQAVFEHNQAQTALDAIRAEREAQLAAARQNVISQTTERVRLQHEAVDLSAEEARIRLSMLPTMERMAATQRDITEQQIRARQAALGPQEILEDFRYEQQRDQLILNDRNRSRDERLAARRELRGMIRAEPGIELAALEAGRPVTLAGRAATRIDMQAQLLEIAQQRALAGVQGAEQQNQLVSAIVAANLQAAQQYQQQVQIPVTINVQLPDGGVATYNELIEANGQSKQPPPQQISAVRRN